jgi:WD40 repeat protein
MQFEITDRAAIALAHEFYGAVADGFPIDAALAEARLAILDQSDGVEWATPVLYMRAASGQLFDIAPPAEGERWHTVAATGTSFRPPEAASDGGGAVAALTYAADDEPTERDHPKPVDRPSASGRSGYLWVVASVLLLVVGGLLTFWSGLNPDALLRSIGVAVATPNPQPPTAQPVPGLRLAKATELKGHADSVRALAFSRDGRRLVSTSGKDPWTLVWEASSGQRLGSYRGHSVVTNAVGWDTGQWLDSVATGAVDGTVRLWNPTTGRDNLPQPLRGHRGAVWAITWAPGGGLLASTGEDEMVRVWAPGSGQPPRGLETGHGVGRAVAWAQLAQGGQVLAVGGADGAVALWDAATWQPRPSLRAHQGAVNALAWSTEAQLLASGSDDEAVRLWRLSDGSTWELRGHQGPVSAVAWSPDGRFVASGSYDTTVRVSSARANGSGLAERFLYNSAVTSLAWAKSDRGTLLAVGLENGQIDLLELQN